MPKHLKRITGRGDLHFITRCCYQRRPLLASPRARNLAVRILKQIRAHYSFRVVGYAVMPEHRAQAVVLQCRTTSPRVDSAALRSTT